MKISSKSKKSGFIRKVDRTKTLKFPTAFHKLCSDALVFNLSSKHIFFSHIQLLREKDHSSSLSRFVRVFFLSTGYQHLTVLFSISNINFSSSAVLLHFFSHILTDLLSQALSSQGFWSILPRNRGLHQTFTTV